MRSWSKLGLTETVVVVQRWLGSRVTLMLSLIGNINVSSLFPQYLITAMFVGVLAVTINTHFSASPPIFCDRFPFNFNYESEKIMNQRSEGYRNWEGIRGLANEYGASQDAMQWMSSLFIWRFGWNPPLLTGVISSKRSVGLLKIWMKYSIDMDPFWQMLTSFEFYILATIVFVIRTHGHYSFILLELATGHFWSK